MSKGLFANWRFRTSTPTFQPGEKLEVYLTHFEGGRGEARVGDTILEVEGASAGQADQLVEISIESFDKSAHRGKARIRSG